jgi:hypothetical protein
VIALVMTCSINWDNHYSPRCLCGLLAINHLREPPDAGKVQAGEPNYEELLRFRVVSTVCTSEVGAHIFGIIGIVVRTSSEHISSVNLRAQASQAARWQ